MTVFLTALKRILKDPVNWALLLLFPLIFAILIGVSGGGENIEAGSSDAELFFGLADQDESTLSRMLVKQMGLRFNNIELSEGDISAKLTEQDVPWILVIREGYERDLLAGRQPVLEGYSLAVSDVSALGAVTAQNITRALLLLGTNDQAALAAWEEAAQVQVTLLKSGGWAETAFWFGFFGFIAIFTAYFIVKTLLDDRRRGMPDRIGVLPLTPRSYLVSGTLAAFAVSEITVALLLLVVRLQLGTVPNALHLFGLLSLYNLFAVAMVSAIVSFAKDLGAASVVNTMLATIFAMLGGLFWPLEVVPEFMRKLALISPGYWLARGLSSIQEITFEGYFLPLLLLSGFTLLALLLGGWKSVRQIES
ncbi:MAG: ABC transporter permease [Clostridiales bacterium]|nr:ABC transporter permease [Clostridiales bacterium]